RIDVAPMGHSIPHPKELIPFSCLRMISILKSYVVFSYLNQAPGATLQQNLPTSRRTSKENQNANESYPNMSTLFPLINHADSCKCLGAGLQWLSDRCDQGPFRSGCAGGRGKIDRRQ